MTAAARVHPPHPPHPQSDFPPYESSKLTMLLEEALGGNSTTGVVLCLRHGEPQASLAAVKLGRALCSVQVRPRAARASRAPRLTAAPHGGWGRTIR